MPPNESIDQRTKQAIEVLVAVGVLGAFHLLCLAIGYADSGFVFGGYLVFSCIILPILSIFAAFFLNKKRSWHSGQIIMFIGASTVMSFFQFILVGQATAV
jgi:uncharacterized membrane protein